MSDRKVRAEAQGAKSKDPKTSPIYDPSKVDPFPVTYQSLSDHFGKIKEAQPFALRKEAFLRIEKLMGDPLLCYVARTHGLPPGVPAYIEDVDLTGFADLIHTVEGKNAVIFLVSNGGSAEATERIVRLLRERFEKIKYIIPANAYSAATLACFSADEIIMDSCGTLGPVDPQLNGVPARAILRAFEGLEKRLKEEGPRALTAYMPLIQKYDLHTLEMCKSAEDLSKELAGDWLSQYMLKCSKDDARVTEIVNFFSDYDEHKSHGRSISREKCRELGLNVTNLEDQAGLSDLVRSLYNQYELWFDKTPFYKLFENASGINWGRQILVQQGEPPRPSDPGPPERSG